MSIISKDKFCKILYGFMEEDRITREVDSLISDSTTTLKDTRDFFSSSCLIISNRDIVIDLLETMFDDKDENISYWLYELDYGRRWYPGIIREADGYEPVLETPEDLYEYLIYCKEKETQ